MASQLALTARNSAYLLSNRTPGSWMRKASICNHHSQLLRKHFYHRQGSSSGVQNFHNVNNILQNPVVSSHRVDTLLICNHKLLGVTHNSAKDLSEDYQYSTCLNCNVASGWEQNELKTEVVGQDAASNYGDTSHLLVSYQRVGSSSLSAIAQYSPLVRWAPNDTNWIVIRGLHSGHPLYEETKSKVEETVKVLKEEKEKIVKVAKEEKERPETTPTVAKVESPPIFEDPSPTLPPQLTVTPTDIQETESEKSQSPELVTETDVVISQKRSIRQRIVDELQHYYHGFRLLFIDIKISCKTLLKILSGKTLTRRERRQLVRTTADIFRLVPFSVFLIVPFMEFLLPFAVRLFPDMLPSTFKKENKEQEKLRRNLKVKLQMAKFLQDTVEEMALERRSSSNKRVKEFKEFMKRIRSSGEQTTNEEILKYSKLFRDELTLDNLQHSSLVALCSLLSLPKYGTDRFLRFRLRMKLRQLASDDRLILKEGIDSLAPWEIQEACRNRGMRGIGVPKERLKNQLEQWLDLHLRQEVPASLLLLSRVLYLSEAMTTESLKKTLSELPETTADDAKVQMSEIVGERVDPKTKVKVIKQEEELIKEEEEEVKKQKEEAEKVKKLEDAKVKEEFAVDDSKTVQVDEALNLEAIIKREVEEEKRVAAAEAEALAKSETASQKEILVDKAEEIKIMPKEEEQDISVEELEEIEEVLEQVAEERTSMKFETENLQALKEDVSEYQEKIEDLKEVIVSIGGSEDIQESKAAKRLSKRVKQMISQMDDVISHLQDQKETLQEDIEVREVRIKHSLGLKENEEKRQEALKQISEKKDNLISINEVVLGMKRLQKVSDETRLQQTVQFLDEDKDGNLDIDAVLKVIELLGRENVKVTAEHMGEILNILRSEAKLEEDEALQDAAEQQTKEETPAEPKEMPGGRSKME